MSESCWENNRNGGKQGGTLGCQAQIQWLEKTSEEVPFKPRQVGCGGGKCVPARVHPKPLEQWDIWNEVCPVSEGGGRGEGGLQRRPVT